MSTVNCPGCSLALSIPPELVGQSVTCPECSKVFITPSGSRPSLNINTNLATRYRRVSTSLTDIFTDFQFDRFATPLIIKIIYCLYIAFVVATWLLFTFVVFYFHVTMTVIEPTNESQLTQDLLFWAVFSLGYFFANAIGILLLRISLESVIVLFRIQEHLEDIASKAA